MMAMGGVALHSCVCTSCGGTTVHGHAVAISAWECGGNDMGYGGIAVQSEAAVIEFPDGSKTFELVAKFSCYGVKIDLSLSNVASLRRAREFLEMTEEYSEDNLISKIKRFLSSSVLNSIKDSITTLKSCKRLMSMAEELDIASRVVFDKAAMDQLIRENVEKSGKLRDALDLVNQLGEKLSAAETSLKKSLEEKASLEARLIVLGVEKKQAEDDKENHGLEMFVAGFERAVEQAKFLVPDADLSRMDPCKVIVGGELVEDDDDAKGEGENPGA
ncbi:hypothetical protein HN51_048560 [Arachis hypogaea]